MELTLLVVQLLLGATLALLTKVPHSSLRRYYLAHYFTCAILLLILGLQYTHRVKFSLFMVTGYYKAT